MARVQAASARVRGDFSGVKKQSHLSPEPIPIARIMIVSALVANHLAALRGAAESYSISSRFTLCFRKQTFTAALHKAH